MPGTITVVGLGPGDPAARTVAAQAALDAASRIILRTAIHPGLADLVADPRVTSCDDFYDRFASFDELYPAIVDHVLAAAAESDVVYAVPGQPAFGERTVPLLRSRASDHGLTVRLTPAVSALDEIAALLGCDPLAGELQLIDASRLQDLIDAEPFAAGKLGIDPYRPVLIGQVYSRDLAVAVKLSLSHVYPESHHVTLVTAAGVTGAELETTVPIHAIDRERVDHLTSVWVPPMAPLRAYRSVSTLLQVVAHLRAPGGCPWDREQTHASVRDSLLEEAYEVADAIDGGDLDNLLEELGDLLFHVVFQSQIANEAGHFTIEDVYDAVSRKLIRRHPHVFGDVDAKTPADVIKTWNQVKRDERGGSAPPSLFSKLPKSMPASLRAEKLLRDAPPDRMEPLPETTPGEQLLATIWHMLGAGLDPELELSRALAARYADPDDAEGESQP